MTNINDPDRNILKARTRDNSMTWVLGALAVLALLGVLIWSFSGDNNTTASSTGDANKGSVTRLAPAPGSNAGTGPGAPSRP